MTTFKTYLKEASCPLDDRYGGIPDGGGYSSATEYELTAQRAVEAAHCILGSIHKMKLNLGGDKDPGIARKYILTPEAEHIEEEMGIIVRIFDEYSRDIYLEMLTKDGLRKKYGEESLERRWAYVKDSIESIRETSPRLQSLAEKKLDALRDSREELMFLKNAPDPAILFDLSFNCYRFIILVAKYMKKSIEEWPELRFAQNAFGHPSLQKMVRKLRKDVNQFVSWARS